MIRLTGLAVTALILAACEQPAPAAPPAETPATPPVAETPTPTPVAGDALTATGWGPLRIGMARAEVEAALGPDANPNAVGGPDPESCDEFRPQRAPEGMLLMIENGRLTRISLIRGSTLKTDRGFGLGDSPAAIKAAYGAAATASPHKYVAAPAEYITAWTTGGRGDAYVEDPAARGIVYEVGAEGRVDAIRAGGPSIQYVEGCA